MSQVFGYICSDDSLTSQVMAQAGAPLRAIAPEDRAGLGIGWLQDGRSLLRKHPKKRAAAVDIPSLLADVPSRTVVGHVRHRDLGRVGTKQLQPFRLRNWVYAQHGGREGFSEHYQDLRDSVPDHIRRNIEGATMAELVFHLFYTKVESQLSTTPEGNWRRMYARKLGETISDLEQVNSEMGVLHAVAITPRCLVAARQGEEALSYRLIEGIEVAREEPLFAGHKPKKENHDRFRALILANGVDEDEEGWVQVPERHVLWVDKSWGVHLEEF